MLNKKKLSPLKRNSLIIFLVIFLVGTLFLLFKSSNKKQIIHNSFNKFDVNCRELTKGLGCLLDNNRLSKESIYKFGISGGDATDTSNFKMLSSYSLEEYLPEIGDQGDVGSCVGWATTYYGFTIVKRIKYGKNYPVFSPLSVFNRYAYQNGTDPCSQGAYIDECLKLLSYKGCPFEKNYEKPYCSVDQNQKKYKDCLSRYERLQHNNAKQLKMALTNNNPVIIAINVFSGGKGNNLNTKFLDTNGVLRMENFRNNPNRVGGHALCIVGYDDNIAGGVFKIANSWGKEWGKNGFFWLRYSDLYIVNCAYAMFTE